MIFEETSPPKILSSESHPSLTLRNCSIHSTEPINQTILLVLAKDGQSPPSLFDSLEHYFEDQKVGCLQELLLLKEAFKIDYLEFVGSFCYYFFDCYFFDGILPYPSGSAETI